MKDNFTIFYSWQSDIKTNRNFISNCIKSAIKLIVKKNKKELNLEISLDRDTKDKSGSPLIIKTIFEKIDISDIFICDVSIINNSLFNIIFNKRVSPNPNVLIELGYAIHQLSWDRVICINNLKYGKTEDLPFDIRGNRISTYNSSDKDSKTNLTNILVDAIESIIFNFDKIIAEQLKNSHKKHDIELYWIFCKICSEETLFESISTAVNSLYTNRHYLDNWNNLDRFYERTENYFIDSELDRLIRLFIKELNSFHNICSLRFQPKNNRDDEFITLINKKIDGEQLTEEEEWDYKQMDRYSVIKEPFSDEAWHEADLRVMRIQDELFIQGEIVKDSYRNFVMEIKRKIPNSYATEIL